MYACIHVEVWDASTFPPTLRPFSANYIMGNSRTNFAIRNLLIIFTRLADCNKRYFYNIALVVIIVTQLWNRMKAPSRNSTWPSLHLSTAVAQHARKMADKVNKEEPGLNEAAIPVLSSQFQRHSKSLLRIEISLADRPSQAWHRKTLVSQVWIPSKSFLPRLRGFYVLTFTDAVRNVVKWWSKLSLRMADPPFQTAAILRSNVCRWKSVKPRGQEAGRPKIRDLPLRPKVSETLLAVKSSSAADGPVATETDAGRPAMVAHRWVAPQIHKNVQTQISNRTNTQIFQFADLAEQRRRRKHIMLIANNNKLEKPIILIFSFLYSVHWATGA